MDIVTAFKKIKEDESLCAKNEHGLFYYRFVNGAIRYEGLGTHLEWSEIGIELREILADWEVLPIANLTS